MNTPRIPPAVIENQHTASDPALSAWVSANAGAGKTHVLAQRVIRLLLQRHDPAKILCLTFTKAAAANMANRIFATLRDWIALDDDQLDEALAETGARAGGAEQRQEARRLFARALETPGGLKVQTIHGFCTRLLQQFPFEANVPARFRVLEDMEQRQLLEQIRRAVLFEASNDPGSRMGQALTAIISAVSDYTFQEGLDEAIRERDRVQGWLADAGGLDEAAAQLSRRLGIEPQETLEGIEAEMVDGPHLPREQWLEVEGICRTGTSNDQSQARRLQEAAAATGRTRVEIYLAIFFTGDGPRKSILTGSLVRKHPDLARRLDSERDDRLPALCVRRNAAMIRDRTMALIAIASEVIGRYRREKNRGGLLDFDDLIARTRDLLRNVDAGWVHYKLDLGVDHVLIDEAQDTSPEQWDIIRMFVAEFTAGAGARGAVNRTVFAVGDHKQSIFSFQGAEPEAFDRAKHHFDNAYRNAGLPFHPIDFRYSFRSAPLVLQAVDAVFLQPDAHKGLRADPVATEHEAVRAAAPGLVELWGLVQPEKTEEKETWDEPFDTTSETSPRVVLANMIRDAVRLWLKRGDLVGDGDKRHALRPGDILILVRQRGPLFEAIIRALKSSDIAVAGADRLQLVDHIAVMDLLALGDALLHPRDDLALATVLKSPLFGVSEEELFRLAREGQRPLRAAVRSLMPELGKRLDALTDDALTSSPFAFYARLLGSGGRRDFLARLGNEANDALDEFLNLALAYESRETPSLQGFVHWLRTASTEVKRDMEIARDEVRVMTVHGAKGLEAPVVVLADTITEPAGPTLHQPKLYSLPPEHDVPHTPDRIAWMPNRRQDIKITEDARATMIEDSENEYRRLLYVAMTRAADRLIVCGAAGKNKNPPGCWYELIERGLEASDELTAEPGDIEGQTVRRFRKFENEAAAPVDRSQPAGPDTSPEWLRRDAEPEASPLQFIRPSDFESEPRPLSATAADTDRSRALARGTHIHRLMQSLPDVPATGRLAAARNYLARQHELDDSDREEIAASVLRLLGDLQFDRLFLPGSRAEVSIVGKVGDKYVSGQVDRLVVSPDHVMIVDYKSNRPAPRDLAEAKAKHAGYVRQLALYRAVLSRLYPGHPVRAALLWTDTSNLMEVPAPDLDAALP
jgi:ATP-dependent helicase/nuclease subunit A